MEGDKAVALVRKWMSLIDEERKFEVDQNRCMSVGLESDWDEIRVGWMLVGAVGQRPLPQHKFRSGDVVALVPVVETGKAPEAAECIVFKADEYVVTVAVGSRSAPNDGNDAFISDSCRYKLNRLANDAQYDRIKESLAALLVEIDKSSSVLFGLREPEVDLDAHKSLTLMNTALNGPQVDAVKFCLDSKDVAMVHGPPGTGKTTVLVEIIRHLLQENLRILVCAPSNVAVDNILERLRSPKRNQKIVRIGHPSRLLPSIIGYSLDMQMKTSDEGKILSDIREEMDSALSKISKAKRELYAELKALRREYRKREPLALKSLISSANIIASTLSSAGSSVISSQTFDVVFIDEVSQATEPECWIALLKAKRAIIAGDPFQLPPTIMCPSAAKKGLEFTLFDRLHKHYGDTITKFLSFQYRMHPKIMDWASDNMYQGRLKAFENVKEHYLVRIPGVEDTDDTTPTLVLIDTAGCGCNEMSYEDGDSKYNDGEARLVEMHVNKLIADGVKPEDIAVISPYSAQVQLIKNMLRERFPKLEIGTVDGFQGREKEVVVISLVRSNDRGEVGFLSESRRLNVALTRAKRQVCIICDSETVERDTFMKKMLEYYQEHADSRYAYLYPGFE